MKKTYFTTVVDKDGVITFPEDFLEQEDWRVGDELSFKVEGETLIIRNVTKENRERLKSKSTS